MGRQGNGDTGIQRFLFLCPDSVLRWSSVGRDGDGTSDTLGASGKWQRNGGKGITVWIGQPSRDRWRSALLVRGTKRLQTLQLHSSAPIPLPIPARAERLRLF